MNCFQKAIQENFICFCEEWRDPALRPRSAVLAQFRIARCVDLLFLVVNFWSNLLLHVRSTRPSVSGLESLVVVMSINHSATRKRHEKHCQ